MVARIPGTRRLARVDDKRRGRHLELDRFAAAAVTSLVGAAKPHHLPDAVAALDVVLTEEEITALEEHYTYREPTYF